MQLAPFHYDQLRNCFAILSKGLQRPNSHEVQNRASAENVIATPLVTASLVDIQPAQVEMPGLEMPALSDSLANYNDNKVNIVQDTPQDISTSADSDSDNESSHNKSTHSAPNTTLVSTTVIPQPVTVVNATQSPDKPFSVESLDRAVKARHVAFDPNQKEVPAIRFFAQVPWQNSEKTAIKPVDHTADHSESAPVVAEQSVDTQNTHTQRLPQKTVSSIAQQSDLDNHKNNTLLINATTHNATPVPATVHEHDLQAAHPNPFVTNAIVDQSQLATAFFIRLPWQHAVENAATKIAAPLTDSTRFTTPLSEESLVFSQPLSPQEAISIRAGHELSDKDRERLKLWEPSEQSNPVLIATQSALHQTAKTLSTGISLSESTELSLAHLTTVTGRSFFQKLPWTIQGKVTRKPILETSP